jgi:hypothetical protein
MNIGELTLSLMDAAECLDYEILDKESSITYPKDLGFWGIESSKIDELKRHLSKLKVELKGAYITKDEFPLLVKKYPIGKQEIDENKDLEKKGEELIESRLLEVELKTTVGDEPKVLKVLKAIRAFPLETHHITNLKKKQLEELEEKFDKQSEDDKSSSFHESHYNTGYSGIETPNKKDDEKIKDLSKEEKSEDIGIKGIANQILAFEKEAWFPGREELRYFEDLAKKQERIWLDAADEGVIIDEKTQTEARKHIKELLDIYKAEISKGPGKDTTTTMFIPFEEDDVGLGTYIGVIFKIYYH